MMDQRWAGADRRDVETGLADHLAAMASGASPPRSVVLRGAAGVGKSHLAARVAQRLQGTDAVVKHVSGGVALRHIDFGALLHLLPVDAPPVTAEFELLQRLRIGLVEHGAISIVIVDDVGMLDAKSAGVIESLLRSGDIVVLATERTAPDGSGLEDHPLTPALHQLADELVLSPLGDGEVAGLLAEWLGDGEIGSVRRLASMSGGNPLALRELIASAQSSAAITSHDGVWHLDDFVPGGHSLEQLVALHLDRLTSSEWDLLRSIAIAGEVPATALRRLDRDALERLEASALVAGDPCRIAHPLYAEVIRAQTGGEETRRLYSKLATSVLPDEGVDPARLGQWMLDSDIGIDDRTARAGAAVAIGRWENELAQRLIEALAAPGVADLVQLQWAHANAGHLERAAEVAEQAVAAASTESERVDAGLARAELMCLQLGRSDEGYVQLGELRASLSDPNQMARVDGATSLYMRMTGKGALADSSTSDVPGVTTDSARLSVALADAFGAVFSGRFEESATIISQGYELAARAAEPHNTVRLGILDGVRHLLSGEFALARETIDSWLRTADVSTVRPAHAVWLGLAAQVAVFEGDLDRAILRGREAARAAGHVDDIGSGGFVRGELRAALVEAGVAAPPDPDESPLGRARAELRLTPDDAVDDAAVAVARHAVDSGYVLWSPWLAMEAVRRGPAPKSAAFVVDVAAHLDGELALACSEHAAGISTSDIEALGSAADRFLSLGARLPALDAVVALVDAAASNGADDVAVRRHLLVARSLAAAIAPNPSRRVAAAVERLALAVDMPSERQLEIARLASHGLSSKAIAKELIVSVRTVDNHLAAVYRTLGVGGRGELADLPL